MPAVGPSGLPGEVARVVRDWFALRKLTDTAETTLPWNTGHSAEGRPAHAARPLPPAGPGPSGGHGLHDRVARFWRSELHVDPDDGPLPDLVPLLEDALGVQVVVARVAPPSPASRPPGEAPSAETPVAAAFVAGDVPFVFVNAARPVVLQRYALAHAFGHLALGHGDVVDRSIEWSRNNPLEAAANDFAEELLAPVRAVRRWYERHPARERHPGVETLLELGNAFGISAWAALYRSRAAQDLHSRAYAAFSAELRAREWEVLPRQAFLGGLRDTLTPLTPAEVLPPGSYGEPAALHVQADALLERLERIGLE